VLLALATAAALVGGGMARAQAQEFPIKGKPVRIVVGFPAGAGVDAQARAVTTRLSEVLGVPVFVENRAGAGTLIAAQEMLRSAPDGHTIFYSASSTFAQNPHTMKAATYDPVKDFTPISMGAKGPLVLVVNSGLPVKNVQELIAYGKAHPGTLSYGSFGTGTSSHIFGQIFARQTGLDMVHVPYRGGADLATDLMGGRVPMAFDAAPAAIQNSLSGKARIIAVAAPVRSEFMPDVPTLSEQGVSGMDLTSWLGWFGPARLPAQTVQKLNAALADAIAQPQVQRIYKEGAYTAESSSPEVLAQAVRDSYERWGTLVRQAGIPKQ